MIYQSNIQIEIIAPGHPASGGRDWIARMLNAVLLAAGQWIGVSFDLAKAHHFSTDGGRSIAAAGG